MKQGRPPYVVRIIRARPRLFLSGLIGLAVMAALPAAWRFETRLLVAWDIGIALYLVLVYELMARRGRHYSAARDLGLKEGSHR